MVGLIRHALNRHRVIFLKLLEGHLNMVGSQYTQRLQDQSKSVEVACDKDRELGKDAIIDPHMIVVVILLPNFDSLVGLLRTHEPLLIIVQLAIGTDMPLEMRLLTTILMYLHTLLHLMLA